MPPGTCKLSKETLIVLARRWRRWRWQRAIRNRTNDAIPRERQAVEREKSDLPRRQGELIVCQDRLATRDSTLKLRERMIEAEKSTAELVRGAVGETLPGFQKGLGEFMRSQMESCGRLEEESTQIHQLLVDLKRELDASIGWRKLAYMDSAAAVDLVKHLTEMFRRTLSQGGKRRVDKGLEQPPSRIVAIDGSAAGDSAAYRVRETRRRSQ